MTTNILSLPQLSGPQTTFTLSTNSDWTDSILFEAAGSPSTTIATGASITSGSPTVSNLQASFVAALLLGQGVTGVGVPGAAVVGSVLSTTSIGLATSIGGTPVNATLTNPSTILIFNPLPLDLTGISFSVIVRPSVANAQALLTLSTSNGMLVNNMTGGTLSFSVPASTLTTLPPGNYVTDIVATAGGNTVNLFQDTGPATVTLIQGVTR